jgi:putative oxidoreductase
VVRIGLGAALMYLGIDGFSGVPGEPAHMAQDVIEVAGGLMLLAGLWTPAMGAIIAVDELWIAFSLYSSQRIGFLNHLFLAVLTAGLAMVGPGAWSIDARLFGRTRFDIDRTRGRKSSH